MGARQGSYQVPVLLYDAEAERAVLGCVMMGGLDEVHDYLAPEDFGDPRHALIYRTCLAVAATGLAVDPVTVASELRRRGLLEKVGGEAYLGDFFPAGYAPSRARSYAEIIKRLAMRRNLFKAGELILELAKDENMEPEEALAKARECVDRVAHGGTTEPVRLADLVAERIEQLESGAEVDRLINTGFSGLDTRLGGFGPGNLVVLAARPGMGKSSLGMQIAVNAAKAGKKVLFFSLEMSAAELVDRVLAWETGFDTVIMRRRILTPDEAERLWQVWPETGGWQLYVDCSPAINTAQISARARRMKTKIGLDLVVVDYLQRIDEQPDRFASTRNEIVGLVTRRLKSMALDLGIPVVALSQLNRAVEATPDRRPGLGHLRDSGSIEQDADFVLFIYRRDYYFPDELENRGKAEIIIAKQRNGPTGSAFLAFEKRLAMFRDLRDGEKGEWE